MLSAITVNRPSQYHHFIRLSFYLDMTKLPYHTETDVTISGKFVTFLLNFPYLRGTADGILLHL